MAKHPVNLLTLNREEARKQAREIGRRILSERSSFRAIWPELAGHFGIHNVPWAPDGMDDEEFGEIVSLLTREFKKGLEETLDKIADLVSAGGNRDDA